MNNSESYTCDLCGQSLDWNPLSTLPADELATFRASDKNGLACQSCLTKEIKAHSTTGLPSGLTLLLPPNPGLQVIQKPGQP